MRSIADPGTREGFILVVDGPPKRLERQPARSDVRSAALGQRRAAARGARRLPAHQAGEHPARRSRACRTGAPAHAGPPPRGGRAARRRRYHVVHVARAGARRARLARGARGAGARAAADARRADPPDPARPRRGGAAVQVARRARVARRCDGWSRTSGANPAYVLGRRWDYLAWNQACERVFGDSDAVPTRCAQPRVAACSWIPARRELCPRLGDERAADGRQVPRRQRAPHRGPRVRGADRGAAHLEPRVLQAVEATRGRRQRRGSQGAPAPGRRACWSFEHAVFQPRDDTASSGWCCTRRWRARHPAKLAQLLQPVA